MSIKNLFDKDIKAFQSPVDDIKSASVGVESFDYMAQKQIANNRYTPPVDFSTASNFAKFGSAELYYEYAFKRICNQYPYDGTLAEKEAFNNKSTHLDRYVFENLYPRTNGHVIFGYQGFDGSKDSTGYNDATTKEYIYAHGGIHTASVGMTGKAIQSTFSASMEYNVTSGSKKGSSFEFTAVSGSTVEFWLKKDAFDATKATKEVVFDLWNQETEGTDGYGRALLNIDNSNNFTLTWNSGSTTGTSNIAPTLTIADSAWHHYAVSFQKSGSVMDINFYRDGRLEQNTTSATTIGDIRGVSKGLRGVLGALNTAPSGTTGLVLGDGKLSASMDEFRYWKKARTAREIGLDWFDQVGGGTNKFEANRELGVYYKFNEGIVGNSDYDTRILDYSGRIANGLWVGYTSGARSTDSAMVLSSRAQKEFKDPIIYPAHPTVSASMTGYMESGSMVDLSNTGLFYHLMPSWITEQDTEDGKELKFLCQVMASYFDTLYSQISHVNDLKHKRYYDGTLSPNIFSGYNLEHDGFVIPELFVESNVVERFRDKDVNEIYSGSIENVKNLIYQNLYNNLSYIYKSKGTEKSFRNMFRCFGIDTELIKLQLYSDGSTQVLKDNYEFKSIAKPVLNLNHPDNLGGTVFLSSSVPSGAGITFIAGSEEEYDEQFSSMTLECELILPKKLKQNQSGYFLSGFITSSICGFHRALTASAADFTWHEEEDSTLRMYAFKEEYDSEHVRFKLSGSGINLTSDLYRYTYDNEKWLLSARLKHANYPFVGVTGSSGSAESYTLEFYGLHTNANDIVKGPFSLSTNVSNEVGKNFLSHVKRIYAGAHATNFTGSVIENSDVKISQVRYWQSYLSDDTLKQHAYDSTNYGVEHPLYNDNPFTSRAIEVPQMETLALHWDFGTVTGSDSSGNFIFEDRSSGSVSDTNNYGFLGKITKNKHDGKGENFIASSTDAVDKEFIYAAKRRLPDSNYSSDGVNIIDQEVEAFFQDNDRSDNFYSFEKSPFSAMSDEMLNMFATVQDFSNMIGDPVNRYRHSYKTMDQIRSLFFSKVSNVPDPEKYFEYFKWIDASISYAITQLVPASNRFSDGIRNVVESHLLERNKFVEKFPMVAPESPASFSPIKGIGEALYSWKFGHAPITKPIATGFEIPENTNCLWHKLRRKFSEPEPDVTNRAISATGVDDVRKSINENNNYAVPYVYDIKTSTTYQGNAFAIRVANKPYRFGGDISKTIHGGTNYYVAKNRNLVHDVCHPNGQTGMFGIPANVMGLGLGPGQGLIAESACEDVEDPNFKEKFNFDIILGEYTKAGGTAAVDDSKEYIYKLKGMKGFPMNVMSQSVTGGYSDLTQNAYKHKANVANLHSDTVDRSNTVPMQGPFTEAYVGGHQSRHVRLNRYNPDLRTEGASPSATPLNNLDDKYTRPEAWRLLIGDHKSSPYLDGVMVFTPADYGVDIVTGKYPDTFKKKAARFRAEHAKRPVNLRNIAHDGYNNRAGNYNKKYEYLSIFGRSGQRPVFRENSHIYNYMPASLATNHEYATHTMTLFGQAPFVSGNVFGIAENNRQPDTTELILQAPVIGSYASGSFRVRGINFVTKSDSMEIDESGGTFPAHRFLLDTYGAMNVTTSSVATGSSDHDFWANLTSSILTAFTSSYSTNVIETSAVYGNSIWNTGSAGGSAYLSASVTNLSESLFTFASWVNIKGSSTGNRFLFDGYSHSGSNNSMRIKLDTSHGLRVWMDFHENGGSGKADNRQWRKADFDDYEDKWTHLALTYSSASNVDGLKLYINGVSSSWSGISPAPSGIAWDARINPINYAFFMTEVGTSNEWKGGVNEVMWWNRPLSDSQIASVYNCGVAHSSSATLPELASMASWWPFGNYPSDGLAGGVVYNELDTGVNRLLIVDPGGDIGFNTGIAVTGSSALISLTATAKSPDWNATFGKSGDCSFYNMISIAGGITPITGDVRRTHDVVMSIPTSSYKNETIITTRFSSPGGIEQQSPAYLDIHSREYSVHNVMPFRNLSVRGRSSGESGTIRVNSHLGKRDGLQTSLSRHMGSYGRDSEHGYDVVAKFDGSNSGVNIGTSATWDAIFNSDKRYSISCWVNWWNLSAQAIIGFDEDDNMVLIDGDGAVYVRAQWNSTNCEWKTADGVISQTGVWHHVAVTYNMNNTANDPILYINGEIIPWGTEPTPGGTWDTFDPATGGHSAWIGCLGGTSWELDAYVDEFAIWDRTLSHAEIIAIEGNGRRRSLNNLGVKNGLQLWYGMGNGTDNRFKVVDNVNKFYDMSGNERHSVSTAGVNIEIHGENSANYHKHYRNTNYRLEDGSTVQQPHLVLKNDNANVQSDLPRSDFQYSWIDKSLGHKYGIRSGKQRIYGYAPRDGFVSSSVFIEGRRGYVNAITFPTASEIYGE